MSNDLQSVFNRVQTKKKSLGELRKSYKDALETTPGYKKVVEDMQALREQKKTYENSVKEQFADEMETLKVDITSDQEMMSDIALTKMVKGESVDVTDKYDSSYEPVFSVKFKKLG